MMAAYAAKKENANKTVLILEKNEKLGKKIYITGKGRCNVTNNCAMGDYFENITRNPEFMYSSFYTFTNLATIEFFEKFGTKLKVERGNRVFPKSDKSSDVIKAFLKAIDNCDLQLNQRVSEINKKNNLFHIRTENEFYEAKKLIIATGGKSYPGTGSTGDGYVFAEKFGHSIEELKPSLCPILLDDENISLVTGLTVKNANIDVYIKNKKVKSYFGDFLFTHRGLSGPIVLTLSDFINDYKNEEIELVCNFKPAVEKKELENRLLNDININSKKELKTLLNDYFPTSLVEYLLASKKLNPKMKLYEINKEIRKQILEMMVSFKFNFLSIDNIRQAIITKGGVSTLEINPSTMESKLVKSLYFAGEIIDVNGLTGGYNLQIAFSTGYLAGISAIKD